MSKTLEEIAEKVLPKWELLCETCTDTPEEVKALVLDALREAVREERKALREKIENGMVHFDSEGRLNCAKCQLLAALDARDAETKEGA